MQKLFSIKNQSSQKDHIQSRLMIIAGLMIITYALILTLAPAVRNHATSDLYVFNHWLGVGVWVLSFSCLHQQSMKKLNNRDPLFLPAIALLTGIGLMTIWRLYPDFGMRQTIWLAISCGLVFIGLQFPALLNLLRRYKYLWLILGLILIVLTIIFGANPSGTGPKLWLNFWGLYFQPSEPLKLLFIAFMAAYFADKPPSEHKKFENLLPTLFINGIAIILLFFQRDLGTASIFFILYIAMLFSIHGSKLLLWITSALFLMAGTIGYFFIDIVQVRIETWLNPFVDPTGTSYQIIQSWIAIAEGELIGTGPGLGSPRLIPVSLSDFIYAAISEELGYLGAIVIILLFMLIIYRATRIAVHTQKSYHRYLIAGLIFYLGFQSLLIIGGNIGLLPLTGVTLPFVSYGGTSLLVSFGVLWILLTISHQTPTNNKTKRPQQSRFVFLSIIMLTIFVIQIIATSLIAVWFQAPIISRAENPRWIIDDRYVQRGFILDRNNQVIISNTGEIGFYQRRTYHIPLYPIVGYTSPAYGQTGIEASMFSYLRGYQGYPYQTIFLQNLLYNQPPEGLNIRLTLDLNLQKSADALLEGSKGAILIMNANTGEILVMASHPYFDAAQLQEEWEILSTDEDAPLVNRVTQGLYPPGTTLFPFILTEEITANQQVLEPQAYLPDFLQDLICALSIEEDITWQTLINNGCQNPQQILASLTELDNLHILFHTLGFFDEPRLRLNVADADSPSQASDLSTLSKGEDSFRITPLQLAMAASALTNDGTLPGPRIVNAYQKIDGEWITLSKLYSNTDVFSSQIANQVTSLINVPDTPFWEALASTDTFNNEPITWFLSGTTSDWQRQPIVVVVLLESDAPDLAQQIGRSLIRGATQFGD